MPFKLFSQLKMIVMYKNNTIISLPYYGISGTKVRYIQKCIKSSKKIVKNYMLIIIMLYVS